MKLFRCAILMSIALVACETTFAGIRPSFSPEVSAWRATDIVVVTEGKEIDGVLQVIESWKGDLKPGTTLSIPELAEFKSKDARLADNLRWADRSRPIEYVTGNRMVLFLRDRTKASVDDTDDGEEQSDIRESKEKVSRWSGANSMGDEVKYSAAWIEHDKLFYFVQVINPGPSVLCSSSMTETEIRNETADVISVQTALNTAMAIPDLSARAETLQPFIHSSIYLAEETAFRALTKCGPAALAVLRKELNNDLSVSIQDNVVRAMAGAGGRAAGPDLNAFLAKEIEYWKKTAPTLAPGWWNGAGFGSDQMDAIEAVEPFRDRWGVLLGTIEALKEIRYTESKNLIAELNDLWRSLPQMSGDQVAEACDDYLRALGPERATTKHPRLPQYELRIQGNKAFTAEELKRKMDEYVAEYDQLDEHYVANFRGGILHYAMEQLLSFISSQGYLDAGFNSAFYDTARGQLIDLKIKEGKRYRIGEIKIEGARSISPDQIRARLPLLAGDIANSAIIRKWENELEDQYHDIGYLDCSIDLDHEARSTMKDNAVARDGLAIADFMLKVSEGPQFIVDAVRFEGKSATPADKLSGAMSLHSGEKFNQESLNTSIKTLNQQFGLKLDQERNVELSINDSNRVSITIFLDKELQPRDSYGRRTIERKQ